MGKVEGNAVSFDGPSADLQLAVPGLVATTRPEPAPSKPRLMSRGGAVFVDLAIEPVAQWNQGLVTIATS